MTRSCWSPPPPAPPWRRRTSSSIRPARLKFLKSAPTRAGRRLRACSRPSRSPTRRSTSASPTTAARSWPRRARRDPARSGGGALGLRALAGACSTCFDRTAPFAVTGLIAPPQLARGNRDEIVLIVNGRPVRDTAAHPDPDRGLPPAPGARPVPGRGAAPRAAAARGRRQRAPDQGLGPLPLPRARSRRCSTGRSTTRSGSSR